MNPGPLDLHDYLAILWRRKWTILTVAITTTVVALAYSIRQTPTYATSAEAVVRAPKFDLTQPPPVIGIDDMPTEVRVANSTPVTQLASARLAAQDVVPGTMDAAPVFEAETIVFNSVSADPAAAQATANAQAAAYLDLRKEAAVSELEQDKQPTETQISDLDKELKAADAQLRAAPDPATRAALDSRYASLLSARTQAVQRLQDFATPASLDVGQVLRSADLPVVPAGSSHLRDALFGFLVGLAWGSGWRSSEIGWMSVCEDARNWSCTRAPRFSPSSRDSRRASPARSR